MAGCAPPVESRPRAPAPGSAPAGPASPLGWARARVAADDEAGLRRRPRRREGGSGVRTTVDGRRAVVFSGNDYLGLAAHPAVAAAASRAALELGAGSTGSRHLSGCHAAIDALEAELAAFTGSGSVTVAPSGYAANLATLVALGGRDAAVLSDERNHASIIDGCRLSRSSVEVFRHRDLADLEIRLHRARGRRIVVSETVFSMDGTVADVAGLVELARRHGAWLILDEAHATGVLGPGGRGAAAAAGVDLDAAGVVRVLTLSKALGAAGGAVCGPEEVRGLLLQRGRALVYSSALPHPAVAAARAALGVLVAHPELVARMRRNGGRLRRALGPLAPDGHRDVPIVPVHVGDPRRAVALEAELLARGHLVQAVRPPTVPPGTSRLRLVASAAHSDGEIDAVAADTLDLLGA